MTEETSTIPPIPQAPPPVPPRSDDGKEFVQAMNFAIEFLKMDFRNLNRVANDTKMPVWVVVFMAISGVAMAIGTFNLVGLVLNPIVMVLFGSIFLVIFWVLAGPILGGKASVLQHYNTMGLLSIAQWINVIPLIGPFISFFVSFYLIFVLQKMVKLLHGLSEAKAWVVVLIPIAICLFFLFILVAIFGLAILGLAAAASGN